MLTDKDPTIKKAEEILDWLGTDEETVRQYERREMQIHDEITRILGAEQEGYKKGRKIGEEEGRKEGRKEGREEGKKENLKEIIENMLKQNMDVTMIRSITKATIEEIDQIKDLMD